MPRTRSLAWSELKIGIVSLFALVIAAVTIFMVSGEGGFFWQRYSIKAIFSDIQGLKEGAPVRVAGVEVGSVTKMDFVGDRVEVTMEIGKEQRPRITNKSMASLGSVSLLGEAAVDITANSQGTPLPDWGYVPTGSARVVVNRRDGGDEESRDDQRTARGHPFGPRHARQVDDRRSPLQPVE